MSNGEVFLLFLAVIVVNILIHRFIVYQAVKEFIKPYLRSKNLTFVKVEFMGLFDFGDFPKGKIGFGPSRNFGNIDIEAFVYVHAKTLENRAIKFTARISTRLLLVKKVDYYGLK